MQRRRPDAVAVATGALPLALALVLLAPLLAASGHPLGRDLVLVPRQPWTDAALGLGDAAPRAVPLDAVVSALTHLIDGGVLARLVLPLALSLGGWGVQRALVGAGTPARVAAGALAVWNPFVVERLALGQWALLLAYGSLPWIVLATSRYRRYGRSGDLGAAVCWVGLASLTPTGGLFALAAVVAGASSHSRAGLVRLARVLGAAVVLQGPWVVASLVRGATTSDPSAVGLFAPDTIGPGGPVVALLGLGGVWDDAAQPATRGTALTVLAAVAVTGVLVAARGSLGRAVGPDLARRWWWLGSLSLAVACLTALPLGENVLEWAVATVPGAGLLRDGQKLLAPFVLLVALALGAAVDRVARVIPRSEPEVRLAVLMPLVALPLLLLPDATTVTWPTVRPVDHPQAMTRVVDEVERGPDDALVVTLPWRSYRLFSWGNEVTASDPALRLLDADVVASDDLQVGRRLVRGEGPRARAVGRALDRGRPADVLGELGVTWVVVYTDDPDAATVDTRGLVPVTRGVVSLYRVPGPVAAVARPGPAARAAVIGAFTAAALVVAAAGALRLRYRRRRRVSTGSGGTLRRTT